MGANLQHNWFDLNLHWPQSWSGALMWRSGKTYISKSLAKCSKVLGWDNCRSPAGRSCKELHPTCLCPNGARGAATGSTTELNLPALDCVLEHLACRSPWCWLPRDQPSLEKIPDKLQPVRSLDELYIDPHFSRILAFIPRGTRCSELQNADILEVLVTRYKAWRTAFATADYKSALNPCPRTKFSAFFSIFSSAIFYLFILLSKNIRNHQK